MIAFGLLVTTILNDKKK
ncbi:hypothetical protein [Lacticaseibacillus paracasei]|nr:hypothetical protein [Lacticaseibacillus paracasei]